MICSNEIKSRLFIKLAQKTYFENTATIGKGGLCFERVIASEFQGILDLTLLKMAG